MVHLGLGEHAETDDRVGTMISIDLQRETDHEIFNLLEAVADWADQRSRESVSEVLASNVGRKTFDKARLAIFRLCPKASVNL